MTEEIIRMALERIELLNEFVLIYAIHKTIDNVQIIEDGRASIPEDMTREQAIELIKKNQGFPL